MEILHLNKLSLT